MAGEHENQGAVEQPNGTDSNASGGLQEGGITPLVAGALAKLPPEEAAAVRAEIEQRNAELTKSQQLLATQRQKLASDVELANVLREASQDPEFAGFLEARQRGDLSTYYRQRAGVAHGSAQQTEDNPAPSGAATEIAGGDPSQAAPLTAVEKRLAAIERERQKELSDRQIAAFQSQYPDYENYLPAMAAEKRRNPGASLEDLYILARAKITPKASQDNGVHTEQAPAQRQNLSSQPPPPTGGSSTTRSQQVPAKPKTIREAFQQAKAQHNLPTDREIVFTFE